MRNNIDVTYLSVCPRVDRTYAKYVAVIYRKQSALVMKLEHVVRCCVSL